MRGIVLAGGTGSRLWPVTKGTSKHLLPVYDKPMIYYPISTLRSAGIDEVLIITNPHDQESFERLLGRGEEWEMVFRYATQSNPNGLAEAFLIGEDFIAEEPVALILGDNIFHGAGLHELFAQSSPLVGAKIFGYEVSNSSNYGVAKLDDDGSLLDLVEKPQQHISNYAIPGLYFYDETVVERAKQLSPSARGELEITDLNRSYLQENQLAFEILPPGTVWLDTGTFDDLYLAGQFVKVLQERTGQAIGSPSKLI